jgi:hypothetical protein
MGEVDCINGELDVGRVSLGAQENPNTWIGSIPSSLISLRKDVTRENGKCCSSARPLMERGLIPPQWVGESEVAKTSKLSQLNV